MAERDTTGAGSPTPETDAKTAAQDAAANAALQAILPFRGAKDIVDDRYLINMAKALPTLNSKFAKAYEANDKTLPDRVLYALVCETGIPYRTHAIESALEFDHPGLIRPLAAGTVHLSSLEGCRYVMVLERPRGKSLSDHISAGKRFNEKSLSTDIIMPMLAMLKEFSSAGIAHGKVNADNVFFDENATPKLQLGECFSEPCGYSQNFYYETVHRGLALPMAKGEADVSADFFALGRLVLYIVLGINPSAHLDEDAYRTERVRVGSYNLMVGDRELSGMTADLLKGLLSDNRAERWGIEQVEAWLGGKRFNLLSPAIPREAPRPISLLETQFFNRSALAHSLHQHWEQAADLLRDDKVYRWVELSIGDHDSSETMKKIIAYTGGEAARQETDNDNLISKFILLLDPQGPIRVQSISAYPDGIGPLLAEYYHDKKQKSLALLEFLLAEELPAFWKGLHKNDAIPLSDSKLVALQILEHQRKYSRVKGLGFGIERMLYDFNPSLPCLSPLVEKYHAHSIETLLYALEDLSNSPQSRSKDPVDAHIAAFLASRMDVKSVIRSEMEAFPAFKNNALLKALVLLAPAQRKAGNPSLKGLTRWFANRLVPIVDTMHGKTLREALQVQLKEKAESGMLVGISTVISNIRMVTQDDLNFRRAAQEYYRNTLKIERFRDERTVRLRAKRLGMRLSLVISYSVLVVTLLSLLNNYVSLMR